MNPRKNKYISEKYGLTHKQHQAVAELMKPSNKSYQEIAKALGISSRCLYNWRKNPKFQEALENGVHELKERVFSAAEFSVQLDSVNTMLDYEAKIIDAIDLRHTLISIVENQERLRLRIEEFVEEFEQLKTRVGDLG